MGKGREEAVFIVEIFLGEAGAFLYPQITLIRLIPALSFTE